MRSKHQMVIVDGVSIGVICNNRKPGNDARQIIAAVKQHCRLHPLVSA